MKNLSFNFLEPKTAINIESCDLSLAYQCNLQCRICYFWKNNPFNAENTLTAQQWQNVLKQIKTLPGGKNCAISFTGAGEVLLHPQVFSLLELSNKLGLHVRINSNGYIIDKNTSIKLARSGLKLLSLSLDSLDPQTHDFLRGRAGTWEKVMQAIDNMAYYSKTTLININTVINKMNLSELSKIAEWAQNNKNIFSINFFAVNKPFSFTSEHDPLWFKQPEHEFLWPDSEPEIDHVFDNLIQLKDKTAKIATDESQLNRFRAYFKNEAFSNQSEICGLKKLNRLMIDPVGNVSICGGLGIIGNVKNKQPLSQLLCSEPAKKHIQDIQSCKKNCSTC